MSKKSGLEEAYLRRCEGSNWKRYGLPEAEQSRAFGAPGTLREEVLLPVLARKHSDSALCHEGGKSRFPRKLAQGGHVRGWE